MDRRRVVITGAGMVTPLGTGVDKNWTALCEGKSGIGPITRFDASSLKCQVAGEVKDFHARDFMDEKFVKRFDPFIQYAMAASVMALQDAGIRPGHYSPDRIGVVIGTACGTNSYFENAHSLALQGDLRRVPPFFLLNDSGNMVSAVVAIRFGAKGPNHCPMEACAAGTSAIGIAFRLIQNGEADMVLAGGADAGITPTCIASLDNLGALTTRWNGEPERASRPFDADRDGFVTSEGSGIVVLEALDTAVRRGARIYGEVAGFARNCDAYHYTSPMPGGEGQAECMRLALKDARVAPEEVDHINAHGTSTVLNDVAETRAIKRVFGSHARKLAISSNKSMTGHMWGASGAVEAIFSLLTIRDGVIPPTINYETPDPECDLDYVPNKARRTDVRVVVSNSFGFGGVNAVLVLRKVEGI